MFFTGHALEYRALRPTRGSTGSSPSIGIHSSIPTLEVSGTRSCEGILFEGREVETKKRFCRELFDEFQSVLGIEPNDLEIVLIETPRHDWGIRGVPGDELNLNYRVNH
jgi:hypothetical protein